MIDINACLPTPEMKADFERFKTLSTQEERDAFKKEMQAKYNALPGDQREAYKKASESGLKERKKLYCGISSENCQRLFRLAISQKNISESQEIGYIKELTVTS